MKRLVEIRSYALRPGAGDAFHETFVKRALPLLRDAGIDVVAFGRSEHDANAWYLIRAFDDLAALRAQEESFYGSAAWRDGPRADVLAAIERYLDTVVWLPTSAIDTIRDSARP